MKGTSWSWLSSSSDGAGCRSRLDSNKSFSALAVEISGGSQLVIAGHGRTRATVRDVAKVITQRTLRNESGGIMRGLDRGESSTFTRNWVPARDPQPLRPP